MKKKDYTVMVEGNDDEMICDNLTLARKVAKQKSKELGSSVIHRWNFDEDLGDKVIDEDFEIRYEDGKEV